MLSKGYTDELKATAALTALGAPADELLDATMARVAKHADSPLRMAAAATPDAKLYFSANLVDDGDGGQRATPPLDDLIQSVVASSLNFQTGATTGATFFVEGVALALPTTTIGQFRRWAFVLRSDGAINSKYSSAYASMAALNADTAANAGTLFAALDGLPLGWIDLEATATTAYKTAGSASAIIENKVSSNVRIFRFGAGGGAGGGAVKDFKLQAVATPTLTLKGGSIIDGDYEYVTYDGVGNNAADYSKDLALNLTTIFGGAPANATTYFLFIDKITLGSTETAVSDSGRLLFPVQQANFVLSTTRHRERSRYVYIGFIRSATTGNAWSGTGAAFGTEPFRRHDSGGAVVVPETFIDETIITAAATTSLSHNLSGEPHGVMLTYDDGVTEVGLDNNSHLLDITPTQIKVASLGLTFGGGQKLRVRAWRFPTQPSVTALSTQFVSGWFQNTATTTLPHALVDADVIKGYMVEEWNVTTGRFRFMDLSSLVVNFDATNLYLDWTGLVPSATLQYRIIAGGSPLPTSIPLQYGGFTKFVGIGPGSYATLALAVAASAPGDSILVSRDTTEAAGDLSIGVADLRIRWMPNATTSMSGAMTNGLRLTAARIRLEAMQLKLTPSGAQARAISVEAADCRVDGRVETNAAQTFTDLLHVTSGGARTYTMLGVLRTLGTITNLETNNDGAGFTQVWGG